MTRLHTNAQSKQNVQTSLNAQTGLNAQAKLILLAVLPFAAVNVALEAPWWAAHSLPLALWALALSLLFGLAVLALRAATPAAAFTGAVLTASLIFSTATLAPGARLAYAPWRTALVPELAVFLLAHFATRFGREAKTHAGLAEARQERTAAQVAANLGFAALAFSGPAQAWLAGRDWLTHVSPTLLLAVGLAALAEAAADTVSSEIGQALSLKLDRTGTSWGLWMGQPRSITTLRPAAPGTDGAISLHGTLAGVIAASLVALAGTLALGGGASMFWVSAAGGVFGLFFDSLLGATLEMQDQNRTGQNLRPRKPRGWLRNDTVNFLSTVSAAAFALALLAVLARR